MDGTETLEQIALDQRGFSTFLRSRADSEPIWVVDARKRSWEHFLNTEWPSRREEDWMRSDLRPFLAQRYSLPSRSEDAGREIESRFSGEVALAGKIVSRNSVVVSAGLDQAQQDSGVVFASLDEAIGTFEELVKPHLWSLFDFHRDRFCALHAAAWCGGQFVYVPRHRIVDQPLLIQASLAQGASDFGHTLIVLEEGAEATVLYESSSDSESDSGFHCGGLEIVLGRGAKLRYVNFQDWGRNVWHFANQRAVLSNDASLQWTIAALGSRFVQVAQQVDLNGEGSESQVNGVLFTQDRQQMTYNTLQRHRKPQCRSDFLYKSALQDASRTVWRGMIKVDPGAFKTDGYQRNDNLLLSPSARADSIPGLEIEADDVRCTHGSTTGKVDEELIFYAQSRGFSRNEAVRLIVSGFFQQILDRITVPSVRDAMSHAIAQKVRLGN